MASLVTPTELIVWLDIPDDTFPTDRAQLLVDSASAAIRGYCGWAISEETLTDEAFGATNKHELWLPSMFVTEIDEITVGGDILDPADYVWYNTRWGTRVDSGTRWTADGTITYTHGYPTGHVKLDLARTVCLQAAARVVNNPSGLRSEQVGSISWTAAGTGDDINVILTAGDQQQLEPLALSGVA